jgi:hypothetical protein
MSKIFLVFALLFISITSFSQTDHAEKFGNFEPSQLTQTVFPIDSSAEAITLFEKMTSNFVYNDYANGGWAIQSKMHIRIKILKKSAFDEGVVKISYYTGVGGKSEFISQIKGATFNEDGKSELKKTSIFNEKLEKEFSQTKLTFPNVKEGSIIEYEYVLETPLSVDNEPKTWYFQGKNPVLWSEVEVTTPSYFYYKILFTGFLPLEISEQNTVNVSHGYPERTTSFSDTRSGTRYRFAVKNAPSFENEAYITTARDYISKIGFELSQVSFPGDYTRTFSVGWADIDKTLIESDNWGRKLKKNNYLDQLTESIATITEPKERLQKAYDYMIKNFKWNEESRLWPETDLKKVFDNKTGNSTELNGIMLALTRSLKIEANPVILSTRSHGRLDFNFPQLDNFNYTIVQAVVDKDTLFIDVTDPFLPMGSLPQRCINEYGRVIKSATEGEIIPIKPVEKYYEYENFNISYNKDLTKIIGKYTGSGSGYLGHDLREAYKSVGDETFKKKIKEQYSELEISNLMFENIENVSTHFSTIFDFAKENGDAEPEKIYIDPFIFGKVEKNPFSKTNRIFPVNFGHLTNQIIMVNIDIPTGYDLEEMPKNISILMPENAGKFTFMCMKGDKKIQVQSKLQLNKSIYIADDYEYLSQIYKMIVQKHAEQIVLKKL